MAKLNNEQRTFIVQRLACFDTPSETAEAVKEAFGVDLPRSQIQQYDPTKVAGKTLAKKWRDLFESCRQKFLDDTSTIAASHKAVRVARLERMALDAQNRKNYPLAASLLEQIAKEMGGQFTNLRLVAPTTPAGDEPYQPAKPYTDEELDNRIRELAEKTGMNP